MDHPVIMTAVEAAFQEGFSTLRFNFRGVGESEGSYGEGIGEREDVKAVSDYLCLRLKNNHFPLILVGYSFGAWAGFPIAIEDERFKGMVAGAPPLEIYSFGFLKGCRKKKLFIAGNRDLFCPPAVLEEWYQGLEEPKSLAIIPGADHFFQFHTRYLIAPLREFFKTSLGSSLPAAGRDARIHGFKCLSFLGCFHVAGSLHLIGLIELMSYAINIFHVPSNP